jgi:hypothetical protein
LSNNLVDNVKLLKERANLRVLLAATGLAIIGLGLILASILWLQDYPVWQALSREAGALLLVSGVIALLWDLLGKRALLDEVLAKAQLSRDIDEAGVSRITGTFQSAKLDWSSYFRTVNNLDIFVSYARSWRNNHLEELKRVAGKKNACIRVILPDPEHKQTVLELSRRFDYDPGHLVNLIEEAKVEFDRLRSPSGGKVEVWFLPIAQTFSFYIFDHVAVIALYTHRRERLPVPTLVCDKGGWLHEYVRKEFDAMVDGTGLARLVSS